MREKAGGCKSREKKRLPGPYFWALPVESSWKLE